MIPNTDIMDLFRLVDYKYNLDSLIHYNIRDIDKVIDVFRTIKDTLLYKIGSIIK